MNKQVTSIVSGEDRISALPDDIICNILSNLYVDESTRTSILSKRWHNMWLLSPLNISDESIVKQSCMFPFTQKESSSWLVNAMSHIISTHPGPIHTCHFIVHEWEEYHETLVNLLKTLTLKGIKNLQIDIGTFDVPYFVFKCDSLVNVHLKCGSMPAQFPVHMDVLFCNLRKLTLAEYKMNNQCLANLLSSRSITELELLSCYGFTDVVIESDKLEKLYFKGTGDYYNVNLTIKDVPNLETFKCDDLPKHSKLVILNAPKLKVLRRISMEMSMLKFGNYQFDIYYKYIEISGEVACMPTLQSLKIAVNFDRACEVKSVPHFLMCFPCLETLAVSMECGSNICFSHDINRVSVNDAGAIVVDDDYDDYVHLMSSINSLNHHLKNVRVSSYTGSQVHLEFVRFIIANAKVLETLTIVYDNRFKERRMKAQKHFLMQNRASETLRIEFYKSEYKSSSTLVPA